MELDHLQSNLPNMFPLLDLPPEIVLEICNAFLPGDGPYLTFKDHEEAAKGFSDLARLARTCKALSNIVRSFFHNRKGHEKFIGIIPYARNILRSPDLALRETTFRMLPSQANGSLEIGDLALFNKASRALGRPLFKLPFLRLVEDHGMSYRHINIFYFHKTRGNLAYLLLSKLPNLTSISIDCFIWPGSQSRQKPLKLHSLKRARFIGVRILRHDDPTGVDLRDLRGYFDAAPNLEILELERMEACHCELTLPHVRYLRLTDCYMGVDDVDRLLGSRGMRLESFIYVTGLYGTYLRKQVAARGQEMLPNDFIKSLQYSHSRKHLQNLKIDLRERGDFSIDFATAKALNWWYHFHEHDAVSHFMTTLKCFPSLRHVTLTQQCLWEPYYNWATGFKKDTTPRDPSRLIHLLPDSIESFSLLDITLEFIPAIISLAAVVNSKLHFPRLKRVHLRPHPNLIRQHAHAKAHADDPSLPRGVSSDMRCIVDSYLEPYRAMIIRLFQYAGVEAEFPLEVYPIHTSNKEDLERQRRLGHWCHECHFHGDVLTKIKTGELGKKGSCVSAHVQKGISAMTQTDK